jgi:hypothetical protein
MPLAPTPESPRASRRRRACAPAPAFALALALIPSLALELVTESRSKMSAFVCSWS